MSILGSGDVNKWWQRPFASNFGSKPWALSVWFRNVGPYVNLAYYGDGNVINNTMLFSVGTYAGVLYHTYRDAGGIQKYFSPNGPSGNAWHHSAWFYQDENNFGGWLDGVPLTSPTSNGTPSLLSACSVLIVNGPYVGTAAPTTQAVAESAFWRDRLSQNDVDALYKGVSPLRIRPGTMQEYWPLRDSLRNFGPSKVGLTPVGGAVAVYSDHPPVELPPRKRRFYVVPSGNTLSGTLSFGPPSLQGNLLEVDTFSGVLGFGPLSTVATFTQTDSFNAALSFGPLTLSGSFLEEDAFAAALSFGPLTLAATLTQADPLSGTLNLGPLSVVSTLTQADPLAAALDFGPLSASGLLAEVNSLVGSVTFGALSVIGALGSAQSFSSALGFGPLGLLGNLLEEDTFAGTLSFGLSLQGQLVGAMYGVLGFGFTASGTLTQTDAISGVLTFAEVTSEGVITEQDNFIGALTFAPPQVAGNLTARNPVSGTLTFTPSLAGALLEQDSFAGVLTFGGLSSAGMMVSVDPFNGAMTFGPLELAGVAYSELRVPPDMSDIDAFRFARVPFDARVAAKVPLDSRIAQ